MTLGDDDVLERLIAAEQDERRRIALFLHDGPVQQLSGIALMLDGALHAINEGRGGEAGRIIEAAVARHRATIKEIRDISFVLEPVVLRDHGLVSALRALADQTGASHPIDVELETPAVGLLGQTAQVSVYTIVRELVVQSLRRGPPSRLSIGILEGPTGSVLVTVGDDAEPERRRRSLEAIEERVKELHGTLEVVSGLRGTDVRVSLPARTP